MVNVHGFLTMFLNHEFFVKVAPATVPDWDCMSNLVRARKFEVKPARIGRLSYWLVLVGLYWLISAVILRGQEGRKLSISELSIFFRQHARPTQRKETSHMIVFRSRRQLAALLRLMHAWDYEMCTRIVRGGRFVQTPWFKDPERFAIEVGDRIYFRLYFRRVGEVISARKSDMWVEIDTRRPEYIYTMASHGMQTKVEDAKEICNELGLDVSDDDQTTR